MRFIFNVDRRAGLFEVKPFEDTMESALELGLQRLRDEDSGERVFFHAESSRFLPLGWEMIRAVGPGGSPAAPWNPVQSPLSEQPECLELSEKLLGEPPVVGKG